MTSFWSLSFLMLRNKSIKFADLFSGMVIDHSKAAPFIQTAFLVTNEDKTIPLLNDLISSPITASTGAYFEAQICTSLSETL